MANFSDRVRVNTYSLSFFNDNKQKLNIVFLDDAMTITINDPSITDGKTSYPQEMRHSVLINTSGVSALHTLIMEHIIPSYNEGENKDVGVFTNRAKTQMFEILLKDGFYFAVIHDEIENRIPKNTYMFKFDKTQVITDYDTETLSFNSEELDAQFALFCKVLEGYMLECSGITAHEYQYRQSYFIDQIKQLINGLTTKLGLDIGYRRTGATSNNYGTSGFNSPSNNAVEVKETTMNDIMNDIIPSAPDELPFN